jgi:hypothetical protein
MRCDKCNVYIYPNQQHFFSGEWYVHYYCLACCPVTFDGNTCQHSEHEKQELTYEPIEESKTAAELEPGYYWGIALVKGEKQGKPAPLEVYIEYEFNGNSVLKVLMLADEYPLPLNEVKILQRIEYKE